MNLSLAGDFPIWNRTSRRTQQATQDRKSSQTVLRLFRAFGNNRMGCSPDASRGTAGELGMQSPERKALPRLGGSVQRFDNRVIEWLVGQALFSRERDAICGIEGRNTY